MNSKIVLPAGLIVATVGAAITFMGVLTPGFFYPGVFMLGIGLLTCAAAGIIAIAERPQP